MAASILMMCIAYLIIVVEAGPCPETQHCSDCDNTTGHCLTECDTGYFGQMCSSVCSDNCKNKSCILVQQGIGNCTEGCVPGYQGFGCNIPCASPGGGCTACPGGCDGGYCQLGISCVSGCVDSNYGTDCDEKSAVRCPETQHCSDCDSATGNCLTECDTGYFDQTCSSVCSDNCKNKKCVVVENGIGNCSEGCVQGYQGLGCNIPCASPGGNCTACPGGCDGGYCQLGSSCYSGCVHSYYGTGCDAGPCPETQHCSDCDNTTGHCLTECDTGYFDQTCSSVCGDNCKNKKCVVVQHGIGNCSEGCVPGYQGLGCNIPCDSPGGNCTACLGGCDGGYCQLGSSCVSGCVDSYYGTDCKNCSSGCTPCDRLTGTCDEEWGGNDMYVHIGLLASALFLNFCIFVTIYTCFIMYMNKKREERHQEDEDIYLPNVPGEERVAPDAFRHSNARYSEVNDNDMGTVVVFL